MIEISYLPTVNATLNTISGILLTIGYVQIRQRKIAAHKKMHARGFWCIRAFSGLLCYLSLSCWIEAIYEAGMDPSRLLHYTDFAHYFGVRDSTFGVAYALLSVARAV